ncbi:FAD-containing monooxygenase EthA, partial [Escherichia coli]|nr:FAD-containing monooxygenase EthA [Escherichia coli]
KAIADGPSILNYLDEAVRDYGIDEHIRYSTRVTGASWSTEDAQWTVTAERGGEAVTFTCAFLFLCTGYYNYERGYTPDFAG